VAALVVVANRSVAMPTRRLVVVLLVPPTVALTIAVATAVGELVDLAPVGKAVAMVFAPARVVK